MNGQKLESVTEEKNLGIIISHDLKVSSQCTQAYIIYKSKNIMVPLHKSLVHPHFEYCVAAWSPPGLLSIFSKSIADIRYRYRLKKYRRYRYRYFAVKISISRSILRYRYFYSDHTVATSVDGREPRDYGVQKHCRVASYM